MRALSLWSVRKVSPPRFQTKSRRLVRRLNPDPMGRFILMLAMATVLMTLSTLRVHFKSVNSLMESYRNSYSDTLPCALLTPWDHRARLRKKRPAVREAHLEPYSVTSISTAPQSDLDWTTAQGRHEELCGSHARDASKRHPGSFQVKDSINAKSRVLIVGILSPVGIHLALKLVQECGVQHIMGLDDITPNTRKYRVEQMERYALLIRLIPSLERLIVPFVGILPKEQQDRLENFGPTHLVNLYSKDDSSSNTLYHLRSSMTAMDQLFELSKKLITTPNIVYIPSERLDLDHVIASTYHCLYGLSSTSLQLPQVYGPWGHPLSWTFLVGEQTMRNSTGTNMSDVMIPPDATPFLFVDDAVDAILAAMQFQHGVVSFSLTSQTTKVDIERAILSLGDPTEVMTKAQSTKVHQGHDEVKDWIGWTAYTPTIDGVNELLAWHYNRAHPYGGIKQEASTSPPIESLHRQSFPCASECSRPSHCEKSPFDVVAKVSKKLTHGCKYALYMVNLWSNLVELPISTATPVANVTTCRIAFVSSESLLVQTLVKGAVNGKVEHNGWTLVWLEGEAIQLSEADFALAKLSPSKLFSDTVSRAVFLDANRLPVPSMEYIVGLIRILDAPPRKAQRRKIFRSGTTLFQLSWSAKQAARRVIFFGQQQTFPFPETNQLSQYIDFILRRDGIKPSRSLSRQTQFYDQTAHLVQTGDRRSLQENQAGMYLTFPYHWVRSSMLIHDLHDEEARLLRCEWYDEQVFWGNSDLEDVSLAYVLAKRRITGRQGTPIIDQLEWSPLLVADSGERVQNGNGEDLFLRILRPVAISTPEVVEGQ